METANDTAMHVTETKTLCSSLKCPKTRNDEIITKEKEKELLYGNNEDGEDEDAFSEDSLRLKLSDDEAEEQPTGRDVSREKIKQEITNMELGSDVPSGDSSEGNIALSGENLTNGKCNVEINLNYIEAKEEECIEDFASDTIPETDNFYSCQDKYINGDSDKTIRTPFEQSLGGNMSSNQWHYSGHFGNYSRRGKRNSVPRKPYTQSDRYYDNSYEGDSEHINNLYVRGRASGRGYSLYHSREENLNYKMTVKDEFYTPRASPTEESNEDLKNKQIKNPEIIKKKSIDPTIDSSDSSNSCSNYVTSELNNSPDTHESVITTKSTSPISTNDENPEETSDCSNNFNLTSEKNQESSSLKCESSIVDALDQSESNEINASDENKATDVGNEAEMSRPVESKNFEKKSSDAEEVSTIEIESRNFVKENNSETNDGVKIKSDSEKNDITTKKTERDSVKNDDVIKKTVPDSPKNDDVIKKTVPDSPKNDDVAMKETESDDVKDDDVATKETKPDKEEIDEVEMEEIELDKEKTDDYVITKEPNETRNNEISRKTLNEQDSMKVNHEITENQTKDRPSSEIINKVKSEKIDEPELVTKILRNVDDIDKKDDSSNSTTPEESSKSSNEVELVDNEKEESEKSADQLILTKDEKLDDVETQQSPKDSSLVAIEASKTIDDKNYPNERDTSEEPKISLSVSKSIDSQNDREVTSTNETDDNNVALLHCLLKRGSAGMSLDEMELSKRIRIGRKKNDDTSESDRREIDCSTIESESTSDEIVKTGKSDKTIVDNIVTNSNAESPNFVSNEGITSNNVVEKSSSGKIPKDKDERSGTPGVDDNQEKIDDCEVIEVPVKQKQKRSKKSPNSLRDNVVSQEDAQEMDNVRQKRKTAQNAEEIIRKEFQSHSDSESNDSLGKYVVVNYNKTNNNLRSASPPTLKRNYEDANEESEGMITKKLKQDVTCNGYIPTKKETPDDNNEKQILRHVRNFFRRDSNGSLGKLKQEELEELLIQKVVETITMRDEIGKLREQAKISERNQEATRVRCQQLAKQIKDFDMVLSRYKSDLRLNPESKTVAPIKINRSVGLQVNFVTDHGIQNLRQLQQVQKTGTPTVNGASTTNQHSEQSPGSSSVKRSIKVRSPRRSEPPVTVPIAPATTTMPVVHSGHALTATPAALIVSKSNSDTRLSVTPAIQQTTLSHPQLVTSSQGLLVNGSVTNQPIRAATTHHVSKTKNSDLIDLTQEEDKTKLTVVTQNSISMTPINDTSPRVPNVQNIAPRYHTVIQTLPGSMAITAQSGIRVVQPSSQPTPTALVNNMNAPRLTYVTMQGGIVPTRQVVITSTPTPIRPAPANNIRTTFPISGTITNNTVRVLPTTGTGTILYKHPAALPESLNPLSNPGWKLPPPVPSLKISKVANGIVLSWNMGLSDKYAEIASYQLYAYQEVPGIPPNSTLWKKVGDVRALPLPMACTLTQFSEGNNYYFAVRAVDKHSRLGQYSQPGNISL